MATGARVDLCRLSSAAGIELVRAAKREGLPVTCDVSVNHLHLTDIDIGYFNADMRLTPPLRQQRDRDAIRAGLADGTIDALVSDHTPVDEDHVPPQAGEPSRQVQQDPGVTPVEGALSEGAGDEELVVFIHIRRSQELLERPPWNPFAGQGRDPVSIDQSRKSRPA